MQIQRYNAENLDARACYLASSAYVDIIDIFVGKAFEHPAGSIRVSDNTHFTHFVTEVAGVRYIYKVTAVRAINGTVNEYDYELDYLKDFFFKNAMSTLDDALVKKGTYGGTSWSRWLDDPSYKAMGGVSRETVVGDSLEVGQGYVYLLVMNNYGYHANTAHNSFYLLSPSGVAAMYTYLSTNENAEAFYKQIGGLYLLPGVTSVDNNPNFNNVTYTADAPIRCLLTGQAPVTVATAKGINPTDHNLYIYTLWDTGLEFEVEDFRDIYRKTYKIYIPYFGTVDVPKSILANVSSDQVEARTVHLYIYYVYNFIDGTIAYYFANNTSEMSDYVDMPSCYLPSGAAAYAMYANGKQHYLNTLNNAGNLASSLLTSVASGNPMAALSAASGAFVKEIINDKQTTVANELASAAGNSYTSSVGFSSAFDPKFKLFIYSDIFRYEYGIHGGKFGYIYNLPFSAAEKEVGYKYWITVGNCTINGLPWYKEAVKAELEKDYLYLNGGYIPPTPAPPGPVPTPTPTGTFQVNYLDGYYAYYLMNVGSYSVTFPYISESDEFIEIKDSSRTYGLGKYYKNYADVTGTMDFSYKPIVADIYYNAEKQMLELPDCLNGLSGSNSRYCAVNVFGDHSLVHDVTYYATFEVPVFTDAEGTELELDNTFNFLYKKAGGTAGWQIVSASITWEATDSGYRGTSSFTIQVAQDVSYLCYPSISFPHDRGRMYVRSNSATYRPVIRIKLDNAITSYEA